MLLALVNHVIRFVPTHFRLETTGHWARFETNGTAFALISCGIVKGFNKSEASYLIGNAFGIELGSCCEREGTPKESDKNFPRNQKS
eukprot:261422-Amphidinium_carterae.1